MSDLPRRTNKLSSRRGAGSLGSESTNAPAVCCSGWFGLCRTDHLRPHVHVQPSSIVRFSEPYQMGRDTLRLFLYGERFQTASGWPA